MDILEDEKKMKEIENIRRKEIANWMKGNDSKEMLIKYKEERLLALLKMSGLTGETDKDILDEYEYALSISQVGYKIIHERDVDEIYVNNYNSEWIKSWNANMDLQICIDFFAVITYISDYYGKDDSGKLQHIKKALQQSGDESLK